VQQQRAQAHVDAHRRVQHAVVPQVPRGAPHPAEVHARHAHDAVEEGDADEPIQRHAQLERRIQVVLAEQPLLLAEAHSAQGVEAGEVEGAGEAFPEK
jgi:hypothetical protein